MWIDLKRIKDIGKDGANLSDKIIKLQEEVGELSQAFLKYNH